MKYRKSTATFLAVSVAIHGAFVFAMSVPDSTPSAAGPPPALVAQGNSFEDLAQGAQPASPEVMPTTDAVELAEPPPAQASATPRVPAQTETAIAGLQVMPEELSETPADISATVSAPSLQHVPPTAPSQASVAETVRVSAAQPQVIEALPDVEVREATAETVRPSRRPANLGQTPPPPPPQQPARQAASSPRGNASENAQRGIAAVSQNPGQATQSGQGHQVDQAAVAAARRAAANYGNVVMREISRTRRQNVRARGVATVSFRVGASGQLASVGIGRSSGDADLDRTAVDHIRRAAPFPPPPAGAQTTFSVQFQGR